MDNLKRRWQEERLGSRTAIQALLDKLSRYGSWFIRYTIDELQRLSMLFLMYNSSLALLQAHPYVLWMDCTGLMNSDRFLDL